MFGRRHRRGPSDGGRRGAPAGRGAQPGGDVRAMIAMGLTCLQRGDHEQGLRWFAQASRTSDPAVLYDLGSFYASLREPGRAEACFRRSAAGGSADAMNALGLLLKNRGQLGEAERWLRQAAGLGDPHALGNLGNVLERQGDKAGAAQYWRRAAEAGLPQAMCSLGIYLVTRGEEQEARRWYERARGHAGEQPDLHGPLLLLDGLLGGSGAGQPPAGLDGGGCPAPPSLAPAAGSATAEPGGPALVVDPRDPLGTALRLRNAYADGGDPAVLRLAVEFGRMAVAAYPPGDGRCADSRISLGVLLRLSYERDRDPHRLAEAVTMGREGVAAAAPGSLDHPVALSSLACALLAEFEVGRDPAILAEAAELNRQAVRLAPPGHPELANWLSSLSNTLLVQAMHIRDARLTDEAIVAGRAALHASVPGAASHPVQQANLGAALLTRFGYSRSRTDLDEAENLLGQSLAALPCGHPGRPRAEANLKVAHHVRDLAGAAIVATGLTGTPGTDQTGGVTGLVEIQVPTQPGAWPKRPGPEAATAGQRTVGQGTGASASTPGPDELGEVARHVAGLNWQYEQTGDLATLAAGLLSLGVRQQDAGLVAEAVAVQRAAVQAAVAAGRGNRQDQAAANSNLGVMLVSAYEFSRDQATIDDAVRQCRAAVGATPGGHLLYPRFQANLSLALYTRYLATQNRNDLAEAAGAARAAVAGTPGGHPNQAERLLGLTRVLVAQYKRNPAPASLDELIRAAEQSAAATPPGHPLWAAAGRLLAGHQALRAIRTRDAAELTGAAARLREIAVCGQAGVSERIEAAWNWAACLLAAGQAQAALIPFRLAVELLPRSARRSLARADAERPLSLFAGLASSAAACALAVSGPELALRLLEQGRGILLSQALDARRNVTTLSEQAPDLAAEFIRLRGLLDPGPALTVAGPPGGAELIQAGPGAQRRHALAARWDALLAEIRARPGLADFLQPPSLADLRRRATGGPVVIVNVSELRCDALIVDASGLRVVPLPRLSLDEAAARATTFRADLPAAGRPGPAARRISATLAWLWDAVTEPVLHALKLFPGPENTGVGPLQDPPRVWWVPTGALAFLPLHAAGYHAQPGRAVIDLVVSSYLPTVRSLPEAATTPPRGEPNALAVAMPVTPGAADLPGARGEADRLAALVASTGILTGEQATGEAVLGALPKYAWAHFACHAASSTRDAGAARLLVHDHEAHPLTVREIARLRISGGELAYLSACGAAHGPVRLADEAVHVTGAFLLAGYRHVIGTLWSVADQAAADVAAQVYGQLAEAGLDTAGTALALHRSVRKLRDEHRDLPARWAAHIHAGP